MLRHPSPMPTLHAAAPPMLRHPSPVPTPRAAPRSAPVTPRTGTVPSSPKSSSRSTTPRRPGEHGRDHFRVVCRVRPCTDTAGTSTVTVHSDERTLSVRLANAPGPLGRGRIFTFDQAFDQSTSQATVFDAVGAPLCESVLDGFNATIFAYGQTGSGKTFTMHGGLTHDSRGLMLRAVEALFDGMKTRPDVQYRASVTYLQLYNEIATDCLVSHSPAGALPGWTPPALRLREDGARVHVEGLRRATIGDPSDAAALLAEGAANRAVGGTSTNLDSSRSHAVFTITLSAELSGADGLNPSPNPSPNPNPNPNPSPRPIS